MSSSYQKKAPWDRNNKHWCQYCRIYVHDNKSSRSIHESGAKHKANVQKYLRQITKDAESKRAAEAQIAAQMEKIESAAAESYKNDMGALTDAGGIAPDSTTKATSIGAGEQSYYNAAAASAAKVYATEDADQAKSANSSPNHSRPTDTGTAGAWEVIEEIDYSQSAPGDTLLDHETNISGKYKRKAIEEIQSNSNLRGAELLDEEDEDHLHNLSEFKIREKSAASPSLDDPDDSIADSGLQQESADGNIAKGLFKKRRVAGNRASSRKQHNV